MKNSFILPIFAVSIISAMICFSSPLFGYGEDETAMLNKAYDLVHQAWNPGDNPPSDTERTDLLNQALKLAHQNRVEIDFPERVMDVVKAVETLTS